MACIVASVNPCNGGAVCFDDEEVMEDAQKVDCSTGGEEEAMPDAGSSGAGGRWAGRDTAGNDAPSNAVRIRDSSCRVEDDDVMDDAPPAAETAADPISDDEAMEDVPMPCAVARQCSAESIPGDVSDVDDEEVMEDAPAPTPVPMETKRNAPTIVIRFMEDSDCWTMPEFTEAEYDSVLLGVTAPPPPPPPSQPPAVHASVPQPPQAQPQSQPPRKRARGPGHGSRPEELCGPTLVPTVVARAWWQAARVPFAETKDHRKPDVICHRQEYALAEVEREVRGAWELLAKCKGMVMQPKQKVKKIVTDAAAKCLKFVYVCATHDRADVSESVCGARVTFPTGGSHRGRDPGVNPYCSNKATSARHLCSRCSQLFFRIESTVAFVFMTIYVLTSAGDNVDAHLHSLARLIHWFACTATYLNRSFFYSDIQTWTVSIVNNIVGERVSLAESIAAKLLSSSEPRKLKRASA